MTSIDLSQLRVLDAIDHAVTVLGRDGRVVAWNPGAEALFGWTAAEATGRRVADLLYTETPYQNAAIRDAIARGEAWVGDYEARRKDDSTVLVHSSVSPVRDDTGEIVATVTVSNDVSERRSLEEMVRQDGERLRIAFETARMGAWSWDATTDVVTWDEHMEARYGLSPGSSAARSRSTSGTRASRRPRAVWSRVSPPSARAGATSCPSTGWCGPTARSTGSRHAAAALHDDDGVFLGMVGVGIDIDERKQLEALMLETSQLRATAGLVSDLQEAERIARLGSWRWEAASNTVTLSAEMSRMLASERTMSGVDFQDALQRAAHPDDAPELTRSANEALRSRRRRYVMECRLVVDGDVRQMVHRGEILLDDDKTRRGTRHVPGRHRTARGRAALLATRERLARERHAVRGPPGDADPAGLPRPRRVRHRGALPPRRGRHRRDRRRLVRRLPAARRSGHARGRRRQRARAELGPPDGEAPSRRRVRTRASARTSAISSPGSTAS